MIASDRHSAKSGARFFSVSTGFSPISMNYSFESARAEEGVQRLIHDPTRPEGPAINRPGRQAGIEMERGGAP